MRELEVFVSEYGAGRFVCTVFDPSTIQIVFRFDVETRAKKLATVTRNVRRMFEHLQASKLNIRSFPSVEEE